MYIGIVPIIIKNSLFPCIPRIHICLITLYVIILLIEGQVFSWNLQCSSILEE